MEADFSQQRAKMVDGQLRTTDVTNVAVLEAMGSVPREAFVAPSLRALAYIDEDLRIVPAREGGPARYLMEPSPFARLLQLAEPRAGDRVLVVGAATGYSAAVLAQMTASVVALESDAELARMAREALASQGSSVAVVEGPLAAGHAAGAPYDLILVEGSIGVPPDALAAQLAEGGRLVAVEGQGNAGMARIYLKNQGRVAGRNAFNAAVRPLPGFQPEPAFEF